MIELLAIILCSDGICYASLTCVNRFFKRENSRPQFLPFGPFLVNRFVLCWSRNRKMFEDWKWIPCFVFSLLPMVFECVTVQMCGRKMNFFAVAVNKVGANITWGTIVKTAINNHKRTINWRNAPAPIHNLDSFRFISSTKNSFPHRFGSGLVTYLP